MVSGRFALRLHQERKLLEILTIPARKRLQQLQPFTGRRNVHCESTPFSAGATKPRRSRQILWQEALHPAAAEI